MAEECGDPRALAGAYAAAAMVAERDGDFDANDEYARRAAAAAERGGDLVQLTRIRVNRSQRLHPAGQLRRRAGRTRRRAAADRVDRHVGLVRRGRSGPTAAGRTAVSAGSTRRWPNSTRPWSSGARPAATWWRTRRSGSARSTWIAGDLDAAEAELTAALAIGERSGDHQALTGLSTHARVRYATDPAGAWTLPSGRSRRDIGNWRNWALLTAGWLALCDGDRARARTLMRRRVREHRAVPRSRRGRRGDRTARAGPPGPVGRDGVPARRRAAAVGTDRQSGVREPGQRSRSPTAAAGRSPAAEARLRAVGVRPAIAACRRPAAGSRGVPGRGSRI